MSHCKDCGGSIHPARLEVLPDTIFCVSCADKNAEPFVARMIYSHKTAGEVFFAKGGENVRRLEREYWRGR
ncbi:MAG: TraR/DksA C4-type zinc finger protein [Candidatus Nanopelagicaceae bacterium]